MYRHKSFSLFTIQIYNILAVKNFSTSQYLCKIIPKAIKSNKGSSHDWLTRHLNDPYVKLAKIEQYRARSAFKLIEINEKYKILSPGQLVIECGAAPGSWTQVVVKCINSNGKDKGRPPGKVVAIDRLTFAPVEGAVSLQQCDFLTPETQKTIQEELQGKKADLVLSDMAPNASGSKDLDHENIVSLANAAFQFTLANACVGSQFLCKVWDGYKVKNFLQNIRNYYKSAKIVKPDATRSDSSEIYIYAKGFKG